MSLTDGPLYVAPIMALQALKEAGVTLTGKIERASDGVGDRVLLEGVWRAEVRSHLGESAHFSFPIVVTAEGPTVEEAADAMLGQIRRIAASTAAETARVAGTPARAW